MNVIYKKSPAVSGEGMNALLFVQNYKSVM
jgi:hypothetical protein